MTSVLVKRGKFGFRDRQPQRQDSVKTQGEKRPHGCQQTPEARRYKEGSLLEPSEGSWPFVENLISNFQLPEL